MSSTPRYSSTPSASPLNSRAVIAGGYIIWVNLLGQGGPLYVPAADIANTLPGNWTGTESTAG
jgi:hypothetical protein